MDHYDYLQVDSHSTTPKYRQIVTSIQRAVDSGRLTYGSVLPSMNDIRALLNVSRDTVFKAYQELKTRGIISSSPGKGYFISSDKVNIQKNVFLLLDNFTSYKEVLFNAFRKALGDRAVIDLYFHHFKDSVFQTLITSAVGKYTDYVIMPLEDEKNKNFLQLSLDSSRVYILDTGLNMYGNLYPSVCQNFANEMYISLTQAREQLAKYSKIMLVWGVAESVYQNQISDEIIRGLEKFCEKNDISLEKVENADDVTPEQGCCYFISYDFDLVTLVNRAKQKSLQLGKDIGIISFNESPLMAIAGGGITTISADFEMMGKTMADLVLNHKNEHIETPFSFIQRPSI